MRNLPKVAFAVCFCSALCQTAIADGISTYDVTLDTAPLAGDPAGPFYMYLEFIDGSGIGDGNNTATLSNFTFGGGSALGGPVVFGGTTGSLETGVSITDTSFVSVFSEQFTPGIDLSFSLGLTNNDDSGGIPDGFTFFLLDNSGTPLPTLAPGSGDYFFTAALGSNGPVFDAYGSDPTIPLSVGPAVSISAPTITPASSVPEPSLIYILSGALVGMVLLRGSFPRSR